MEGRESKAYAILWDGWRSLSDIWAKVWRTREWAMEIPVRRVLQGEDPASAKVLGLEHPWGNMGRWAVVLEMRLRFPFFLPKSHFWEAESSSLQQKDTFSLSDSPIYSAVLSSACLICRRNTPHPLQYTDEQDLVLCLATVWRPHARCHWSGRENFDGDSFTISNSSNTVNMPHLWLTTALVSGFSGAQGFWMKHPLRSLSIIKSISFITWVWVGGWWDSHGLVISVSVYSERVLVWMVSPVVPLWPTPL